LHISQSFNHLVGAGFCHNNSPKIYLLLGLPGLASAAGTNEPSDGTLLVDCPYSNSTCNIIDVFNSAGFTSNADGPESPPSALHSWLCAGCTQGNHKLELGFNPVTSLYLHTWWKTNSQFEGVTVGNNKLLVFGGPGHNDDLGWAGQPNQLGILWFFMVTTTSNNCHLPASTIYGECANGGMFLRPNMSSGFAGAGTGQHELEVYLRKSTTSTSRDGVVMWFLDGQAVGRYTNLNYMPGGINLFQLTHTWDGSISLQCTVRDCSKEWIHDWDHIRIRTNASIPGGGGQPLDNPPGPPGTVTGVTVTVQ